MKSFNCRLPGLIALASIVLGANNAMPDQSDVRLELLKVFRQEFVAVTPGKGQFPREFKMGSDSQPAARPIRTVRMEHDFLVAKYEVPQNLWAAVMGTNPSRWKGDRNSVEMLTHGEAAEFCKKATAMMREARLIGDSQLVRLPTEAEWEYVARAGTATAYSFGEDETKLGQFAWFTGNAAGNDPPVGAKQPNPWGLYDIHGYLWEWCGDPWHANYGSAPKDGSSWTSGGDQSKRVLRGGSWKDPPEKLASFFRRAASRDLRDDAVGLRCVLAQAK